MPEHETTPAPLFSDADLETINAARDVLARVEGEAKTLAWNARPARGLTEPQASDYALVQVRAEIAGDALFDLLNATSAHNVQRLTGDVVHNREAGTWPTS